MKHGVYNLDERAKNLRHAFLIGQDKMPVLSFMDSMELIQHAINCDILRKDSRDETRMLVYRKGTETALEGWYSNKISMVAQELMYDENGVILLQEAIKEKENEGKREENNNRTYKP